ncbi:unnamed protein product [Rhizophagus irregularis]|nr:unnamed protein product [Rhizophagus irregularis]
MVCVNIVDNINIEEVDRTKYANLNCCYNTVQNSSTWTRVIDDFQSFTSEPSKSSEEHFIIYGAVLIIYAYLF